MAKILVSLVSDQTIPNVLFINEMKNIDKYIFISTRKMEKKNKSQHIIQASDVINDDNYEVLIVKEDSLQDIEKELNKLSFQSNEQFWVNLTAGTKIMAIGVYDFFKNMDSKIIYIPIGKNHYRILYPKDEMIEESIVYRIGVKEYLTGYGITIKNPKKIAKTICFDDETQCFFDFYLKQDDTALLSLNCLREFRGKKVDRNAMNEELKHFLSECPVSKFQNALELQKDEVKYLTGEWFEEYIYFLLKKYLKLDNSAIAIGVQINRENVNNEIDIMFTFENRLYVIECKTSIYDTNQKKNILNDTLYKISALKKDFGLFVKPYLFTLSQGDTIKENHIFRSELLGIVVVDRDILINPAKNFDLFRSW